MHSSLTVTLVYFLALHTYAEKGPTKLLLAKGTVQENKKPFHTKMKVPVLLVVVCLLKKKKEEENLEFGNFFDYICHCSCVFCV